MDVGNKGVKKRGELVLALGHRNFQGSWKTIAAFEKAFKVISAPLRDSKLSLSQFHNC